MAQKKFNGKYSCKRYHVVCSEDFDSHPLSDNSDFIHVFLNESDGVIDSPNPIRIFTVFDISSMGRIPALTGAGRIIEKIDIVFFVQNTKSFDC